MLLKFQELIDLCSKLRSEEGCPWDKKQTYETMKKCIVDESAEVVEAIDKKDNANLEEELGDLLFNILLIAQIASEKGDFDMKSVMTKIGEKIVKIPVQVPVKLLRGTPPPTILGIDFLIAGKFKFFFYPEKRESYLETEE